MEYARRVIIIIYYSTETNRKRIITYLGVSALHSMKSNSWFVSLLRIFWVLV